MREFRQARSAAGRILRKLLQLPAAVIVVAAGDACGAEAKTVVFLQQAATQREAMATCLRHFTEEAARLWQGPVTVLPEDVAAPAGFQEKLHAWMHEKYGGRRVDLVVAFERPGSIWGLEFRSRLWPETPLLLTGISAARYEALSGKRNVTGVTIDQNVPAFLSAVHRLLPGARNLAFVSGFYHPLPREREAWVHDSLSFATEQGLAFHNLAGIGKPSAMSRLQALPRDSMIIYREVVAGGTFLTSVDSEIAAAAPGPVFAVMDARAGEGVTGAVMLDYGRLGDEIAAQAAAVLKSRDAGAVPPVASRAFVTTWDWRELQRWNLDERRLPAGAEIRFRRPGLWEEYRTAMLGITAAILVQGILIAGLLVQRRQRKRAEALLHREREHLAHTQRVATVNQMATALTHELNQPLTAMVNNAGAARRLLEAGPARASECREILTDIERDGQHAGELLQSTRDMLRPAAGELQRVRTADLIESAKRMTAPECASRGCTLSVEADADLPEVHGRPVEIQQVLVNLLLNAMDAAAAPGASSPRIVITASASPEEFKVGVRDFGPGLPPGDPARWFEEFQTTKPGGMGMGLAISRTIVEAHGGTIRAENAAGGGACFTFSLPVKKHTLP